MNFLVLFCICFFFQLQSSDGQATNAIQSIQSVKAECGSTCNCTEKKDSFLLVEFRVICQGDGLKQEIILGNEIFKTEPKNDYTRKIYVRLEKFAKATLLQNFILDWLAYTSCSLDLWSCKKIVMPRAIHHGKKNEDSWNQVFAGIGILKSNLDYLPDNLMEGKQNAGIKLVKSKIIHVDLGAILGERGNLNYFRLDNTVVGVLDSSTKENIHLNHSPIRGHPKIELLNSTIGLLGKGGLTFEEYSNKFFPGDATVKIVNTTIGVIEDHAAHFLPGISLTMDESNVGSISPSGITTGEGVTLSIKNSTLGVNKDSLSTLECGLKSILVNNSLLPLEREEKCTGDICQGLQLTDFVHSTCKDNTLIDLNPSKEVDHDKSKGVLQGRTIVNTTIAAPSSNTSSNDVYSINHLLAARLSDRQMIPLGFFYVICGISIVLLLMVLILAAFVIWGKYSTSKGDERRKQCSDNLYEDPVMYFSPRIPEPVGSRRPSQMSHFEADFMDINKNPDTGFIGSSYDGSLPENHYIPMN